MRVRVYDKEANVYFKSEVYAIINNGWYGKYLVSVPSDKGAILKLYDFLDKSKNEVLVNVIIPEYPSEWVTWKTDDVGQQMVQYKNLLNEDMMFFSFVGYSWVFDDTKTMVSLLNTDGVLLADSAFKDNALTSNLEGWSYIETQNDADMLMKQTNGFHDSILKELNYISGAYVNASGGMYCSDSVRKVTMAFDSQWCQTIEFVFEGVVALNLRPAPDNYGGELFDASVFVNDASVYFYDSYIEKVDPLYTGTWIKAFSARWRFV